MSTVPTRRDVLAATAASLALAGCLGGDDTAGSEGSDGDTAEFGDSPESRPAWQEAPLEDVTTGDSFTIAEIDRAVVIHTFATYCPVCKRQQDGVSDAYAGVSDGMEFVDLSIDGNDDPDDVRAHAEDNGYDWRFGIAPTDVTRDLVDEFGQEVTVSSQSPLIIVCPDGSTGTIDKPADIETIEDTIDAGCE